MPFNNDIAGGNGSLVRNWIQSPNFVAGSTGWRIAKDGSCEFNNGTFRGSITSGNPAGQHIVINNGATTDAVDVYNTLNQLVAFIDKLGRIETLNPTGGQFSRLANGSVIIGNTGSLSGFPGEIDFLFNVGGTGRDEIKVLSGHEAGDSDSSITLGSDVGSVGNGFVSGFQRGVSGSLMQSDQLSVNNLVHVVRTAFTTNGAGDASFNPGLAFTPTACNVTPTGLTFTVPGTQILIWRDVLSATNCAFRVFSPGGAAFVGTMTADFTFYG